jgi:bifunctional polynucleotide phosphatase/kinase
MISDDKYRKPAVGMWDFMAKNLNGNVAIDLENSFYVGGAAGRPEEGVLPTFPDL